MDNHVAIFVLQYSTPTIAKFKFEVLCQYHSDRSESSVAAISKSTYMLRQEHNDKVGALFSNRTRT